MEKRKELKDFNPIEQEILSVYWSDHCRHTTFNTHITDIKVEGDDKFKKQIKKSLENYEKQRKAVHGDKLNKKPITLMDLATIGMKNKRAGNPNFGTANASFVDDKIEYNAATIMTTIGGKKYRISFKNETHNSPTEVCPYDGAATALGGAVRDIMAARAYPYQAMRVTGCADPTSKNTMAGKLPQKKITTEAAQGFSDYGKGLNLTAGLVHEIYHEDYVAKRMEAGFIAGVVEADKIRIEEPVAGDIVVLIGARTGRCGVGAATASSKVQNEGSMADEGSKVPKGDPILERRIVELYREPKFLKLVKKCNDFGAGGVSVAIGEIADSLDIYLDDVPQKDGMTLTPLEIAISESQERMAVAIDPADMFELLELCQKYNLEATRVANVTDTGYMNMYYKGELVVSLERAFLNSVGDVRTQEIVIKAPDMELNPFLGKHCDSFQQLVIGTMSDLNSCSQQGLGKVFGQSNFFTALQPFDGRYKKTPTQGSVMIIPVQGNKTAVTISTLAYDPFIAKWSPYYGGQVARLDSLAKVLALGGDYKDTFLTDQEYYASPTTPEKFGHPFQALLGANDVSAAIGPVAIGGKDSMSGSYKYIDVPPTLISFAMCPANIKTVSSQAFKKHGSKVGLISASDENGMPLDFEIIKKKWDYFIAQRNSGNILTARAIGSGGIIAEVCNASIGNAIGFKFDESLLIDELNNKSYGSLIFEIKDGAKIDKSLIRIIGETTKEVWVKHGEKSVFLDEILKASEKRLAEVFPIK